MTVYFLCIIFYQFKLSSTKIPMNIFEVEHFLKSDLYRREEHRLFTFFGWR